MCLFVPPCFGPSLFPVRFFTRPGARLLHAAGRRLDSAAVPGCAELGGGAAGETIGAAAERRKVVGFSGKYVAISQNYGTNDPQK